MKIIDKQEVYIVSHEEVRYVRINGRWHYDTVNYNGYKKTSFDKHIELEKEFKLIMANEERENIINKLLNE